MRLKEFYQKEVTKKVKEKFGFKNDLRVPRLVKILVSIGIGSIQGEQKKLEAIKNDIIKITGQKPIETKAKKAISGFKLRQNQVVGLKITLRGDRMYDFLEKIINIALPRTRDFKGIKPSFDGHGNLTIGIKEQIVFPEIEEGTEITHGFAVTLVTNAKNDEEAMEMLSQLGLRFCKE